MESRTERIRFPGASGAELAARLEMPAGEPAGYALFAHCFTCSKDLKAIVRISRALAARGFGVLRFDFTGLGESAGEFADTNFSSNLDDLVAAANYLRESRGGPHLLVGHSLGGAAVLAAAGRIPGVQAVATVAAPSDTEHLGETLVRLAPELEASGEAEVRLGGQRFRIRRQLLDDLAEHSMDRHLKGLGLPLLIFHSPQDEVVGIEHAARIYKAARHPKSFISLDGADHLLLRREEDSRFVAGVLAAWARRYVGDGAGEAAEEAAAASPGSGEPVPDLDHGEVLVAGGASGYANRVWAGRHRLQADEPERVGGTDTGPDPYGYLLAALGACKSMTLRMYADRKGWPLTGTRVRLRHAKIHATDCEDCETREGKVDRIEVEIGVEGELSDEQRGRLLEIADRCPVHRTLVSEISIKSRLGPPL